jgi:hypothetical protein
MEILFELLLGLGQLLCELVLNLIFEALAELGFEAIKEAIRAARPGSVAQQPNRWFAAIGYILIGAIFGLISLWPLPHGFATHLWLRIANLIITPCVAGWAMVQLGQWRLRRNQPPILLHRFLYGYLFALSFAAVRLACTL